MGEARPRVRRPLFGRTPAPEVEISSCQDLGDGRHVLEFAKPSLDLMLYEDDSGTIAEWVTVGGELLALIKVGRA